MARLEGCEIGELIDYTLRLTDGINRVLATDDPEKAEFIVAYGSHIEDNGIGLVLSDGAPNEVTQVVVPCAACETCVIVNTFGFKEMVQFIAPESCGATRGMQVGDIAMIPARRQNDTGQQG